jgi:DNA-binding protein H-NS
MNNLIDIQLQIEKLQKQATQIKAKEFHKTVAEIREKMGAFGITVKDIQSPAKSKNKAATSTKSAKPRGKASTGATVAAKYKGPDGQSWSGRGLTPRWLRTLIDSGRDKEEFLIQH